MTTKKILSVLLALVMTLSLGAVAFADDENYNWVPIPGSPDGLSDGDYYIDWTYYFTYSAQMEGSTISPSDLERMIDVYNNGTWFIDYDAPALKGTVVVPADMTESGEEETEVFDDQTSLLHVLLYEVGAEWIPVAKSTAGLSDGDWYIDLSGDQATIDISQEDIDALAGYLNDWLFFVNANQDSRYMKYKVLVNGELGDEYDVYYLPMFNEMLSWADGTIHILDVFPIQQYAAPENWTPIPTSPDGLAKGDYYLDFTDWLTLSAAAEDLQWTDEELAAAITAYNGGEWYFDADALKLMGTIYVVNPETGTTGPVEFTAESGTYLLDNNILREVDPTWIPVAKSTDALDNGDYYIDLSNIPAGLEDMVNYDYYVNPGSRLMEYRIDIGNGQSIFLPLQDVHFGSWLVRCPITQFDNHNWTVVPTSPDGLPDGSYYFDFSAYARKEDGTLDQTILDSINSCTYKVDFDTMDVEMIDAEGDVLTGLDAQAYLFWLRKTGVNWLPVAKSTEGLQTGDWYLDMEALTDEMIRAQKRAWVEVGNDPADFDEAAVRAEMAEQLGQAVFSINPGDPLFELSIGNLYTYTRTNDDGQEYSFYIDYFFPVGATAEPDMRIVYQAIMRHIHQYTAPEQPSDPEQPTDPETPTEPDAPAQTQSPIQRLLKAVTSFFLRLVDFFKKMFVK